jgi:hypothetical protein
MSASGSSPPASTGKSRVSLKDFVDETGEHVFCDDGDDFENLPPSADRKASLALERWGGKPRAPNENSANDGSRLLIRLELP